MLLTLRHSLTSLLTTVFLLSSSPACPQSAPPRLPHATAQTAADPRPLIVCFGDSLTAGYGAEPGKSYPDFLQQMLDQGGYRYRVVNIGMSGATTKDGVGRLPAVLALHPALVIVEFGGNDGLRGYPVGQAETNLNTIVGALKRNGSKVALAGITLPPQYGGDYIRSFNNIFPTVAHANHVSLLPFLLDGVYNVDGSMQADGIHATATGNQQVARNVERLILPLLRRS